MRMEAETRSPVKTSWRAKLLLMGIGILFLLLLLLATEGVLGVVGYGPPKDLFIRHQVGDDDLWLINRRISELFFPSWATKPPAYEMLSAERRPNSYRIIAMGASTTVGDPFGAQTAFPRLLGEMLRDIAPERSYEVANCGVVAISSLDVLLLHKQALKYDPDAILIYTGHNEAYGADGIDSPIQRAFTSRGPAKFWLWFRNLRLVRLARNAVGSLRPEPAEEGSEKSFGMWLMKDRLVPECSAKHDRLLRFYRANILEMLGAARDKGIDVILCTLVSNVRDQSPLGSAHGCAFPEEQQAAWKDRFDRAVLKMDAAEWTEAISNFRQCKELDPEYAEVRFRLARCLDAAGDSSAALGEYIAARDLDAVRFRAGTKQNEVLREIAREWDEQGKHRLIFVDLDRMIYEDFPRGPGRRFFTEHVHPYGWGHAWIAAKIARALGADDALGAVDFSKLRPLPAYVGQVGMTALDVAAGLHLTDEFKLAKWPFPDCYDNDEARAYLGQRVEQLKTVMSPLEQQIFAEIPRDPTGGLYDFGQRHYRLFQEHRRARRAQEALRELEVTSQYLWPSAALACARAQMLLGLGQVDECSRWLEVAHQRDPEYAPTHFVRGAYYHTTGRLDEADREFRAYLMAEPNGEFAAGCSRALSVISQQRGR